MKSCTILFAIILSCLTASAALIPGLNSGPLQVAVGAYAYNYSAEITGGERLDPTATNGVTCPSSNGALVQCSPAGTFFTIYDFAGFIAVTGETGSGPMPGIDAKEAVETIPQARRLENRVTTRAIAPRERMQIVTKQTKTAVAKVNKRNVKTSDADRSAEVAHK